MNCGNHCRHLSRQPWHSRTDERRGQHALAAGRKKGRRPTRERHSVTRFSCRSEPAGFSTASVADGENQHGEGRDHRRDGEDQEILLQWKLLCEQHAAERRSDNGTDASDNRSPAAIDHAKLLKLLWDALGTEFGGRHELYERNYAGNYEYLSIETLMAASATGDLASMQSLVKDCMSEYHLSGWTGSDLINPDDISLVGRVQAV